MRAAVVDVAIAISFWAWSQGQSRQIADWLPDTLRMQACRWSPSISAMEMYW